MDIFDEYGSPNADDDADVLAQAYAAGRGGVAYILNAPDPLQLATGILNPGLGNEPMVSVMVPPANARTWVVTLLSMRFGQAVGGVAPVLDTTVPRDNQASGFALFGPYAKLQYGTSEAMEEVLFDYPFGGMTFQVTAAMVRLYGPNVPYSSGAVNLPRVGAFISGKAAFGPSSLAPMTFTTPVQILTLVSTSLTFFAPRRAVGYQLFRSGLPTNPGEVVLVDQQAFTPGTGAGISVQNDGQVCLDNEFGNAPQSPLIVDGYIPLHMQAAGIKITGNLGTYPTTVGVRWLLDVA